MKKSKHDKVKKNAAPSSAPVAGGGKKISQMIKSATKNTTDPRIIKQKVALSEQWISRTDKIKLTIAVGILLLGIGAFYLFKTPSFLFSHPNMPLAYASPILGIIGFVAILFYWCSFGFSLLGYVKDATIELKKVVWPDSKTAGRTTLMVMVFIAILATCMWISDSIIQWVLYDLILRRGG
jgi:preprotein translocase, secE subunit